MLAQVKDLSKIKSLKSEFRMSLLTYCQKTNLEKHLHVMVGKLRTAVDFLKYCKLGIWEGCHGRQNTPHLTMIYFCSCHTHHHFFDLSFPPKLAPFAYYRSNSFSIFINKVCYLLLQLGDRQGTQVISPES